MSEQIDPARHTPPPPRHEPILNLPAIVGVMIALCVGIHLVRAYVLTEQQDLELLLRAAFLPIRYSGLFQIEVWNFTSPVSYAFLHGNFVHLAINMVWLAAFGSPLANRVGWVRFTLFWVVTGLAAAGLHFVLHPLDQSPLVGASGAISGMMGAAARFAFRIERSQGRGTFVGYPLPVGFVMRQRGVVTFLAVWMVVNLLSGLAGALPGVGGQIAWEAHVGGFLAGFFGIRLFTPRVVARSGTPLY